MNLQILPPVPESPSLPCSRSSESSIPSHSNEPQTLKYIRSMQCLGSEVAATCQGLWNIQDERSTQFASPDDYTC